MSAPTSALNRDASRGVTARPRFHAAASRSKVQVESGILQGGLCMAICRPPCGFVVNLSVREIMVALFRILTGAFILERTS